MDKHTCPDAGPQPRAPSDFGFIADILDGIDLQPLVDAFTQRRAWGRPGYSPQAMLRAFLVKHLLNIRYTRELIRRLQSSHLLRRLCGFRDRIPNESTFSRFYQALGDYQDLLESAVVNASTLTGHHIQHLRDSGQLPAKSPTPGRYVAIDSTDIEAYASIRRNRLRDPDATWGHRTAKHGISPKSQGHNEFFFGYKLHLTCDAHYGFPLSWQILPANKNDNPTFRPLFRQTADQYPALNIRYAIADRGYDSIANFKFLHQRKIYAVIHTRNHAKELTYTPDGRPYCYGSEPMDYIHSERRHHVFRCPPEGCSLKNAAPWLGERCQEENHETWSTPERLRHVGRLSKASPKWRRIFKKRTSIERLFGSLKQSRLLDRHQFLNIRKMKTHVALSLLSYSTTMLAHLRRNNFASIREMAVQPPLPLWTAPKPATRAA